MESEANELPKGLVLGKDGNIHIRLTGSIPPRRCGILQSTPLRGPTSSSAHFQPGIGSNTKLTHLDPERLLGLRIEPCWPTPGRGQSHKVC